MTFSRPAPILGRALCLAFLGLALGGGRLAAQVNGAIAGRVIDAATGAGVSGVQVRVAGTGQGVATDTGGHFRIREVRPGTWTVVVMRIGYRSVRREGIIVNGGEAVHLDLSMAPVAVEVESLTVRQGRDPILDPLAPASTQRITARDFHSLPITTLDEAVALSGGTVDQSVRGGRPGEQAFVLDGVGVKNQLDASTNGSGTFIPPDMLQEASLVSNSFSARYGSAISGLINVTTREGTERWTGRTAYENDRPLPDGWDYGLDRLVVSGAGPLGRGIRMVGVLDASGRIDAEPVSAPRPDDPRDLRHGSSLLPANSGEVYSGALKLNIPIGGHELRLFALRSVEQRQLFDAAFKYDPRWSPARHVTANLLTAQVQHTFGATTVDPLILDARFGYFDREFLRGVPTEAIDPVFGGFSGKSLHIVGERIARRQDTLAALAPIPGMVPPDYSNASPYGVPAFFMGSGGRGEVSWNRFREARLQLDFTKGLGQGADLLAGTDIATQQVQTFQRALGYLPVGFGDSVPPPTASNFHPLAVGLYLEGQQRFGDLAFTAGVRFDHFDPGADLGPQGSAHSVVGPRVAVSTIFSGATLVISLGKFAQAPDYQFMVDASFDDTARTGRFRQGNPGLGFETATQYEFSLRTRPSPVTNLRLNVYVKRLDGLVASVALGADPDSSVFGNTDYGSVYGAEALFERELGGGFRARINGTVQTAQASASDAFRQRVHIIDPGTHDTISASHDQFPLDYDRRLSLLTVLEYQTQDNWPRALRGMDLAFIGRYLTGLPYSKTTVTGDTLIGPPNSYRLPSQQTVDVLVRHPFTVMGRRGSVYLDIRNIANRRNVVAVRRDTGSPFMTVAGIKAAADKAYAAHPEAIPYESPRYRATADLDKNGLVDGFDELYPLFLAAAQDAFQPIFAYAAPRLTRLGFELTF